MTFTITTTAIQPKKIGTENNQPITGVHAVGGPLVLDHAVDGDAAGDAAAVALRDDVRAGGWGRRRQRQLPRQRRVQRLLRLGVEVEVVDGRDAPVPEDLVLHDFGVERLGVIDQARARLGEYGMAEESAEAVHNEQRYDHHQEDHQQYPDALGETQHQTIRSRPSLLIYPLF